AALTGAIHELPSAYRTVLVLRDVQGLSNPETAELLSLSVHGVKTRVHRARSFLRKELGHVMATLEATPAPPGNRGRDAQGRLLADRDRADVAEGGPHENPKS